jgi:hypothetical protein
MTVPAYCPHVPDRWEAMGRFPATNYGTRMPAGQTQA